MALWSRASGRSGRARALPERHARTLPEQIDTCDRCGMRARLRVVLGTGGELYFCGHHARVYRPALQIVASAMDDVTGPGPAIPAGPR